MLNNMLIITAICLVIGIGTVSFFCRRNNDFSIRAYVVMVLGVVASVAVMSAVYYGAVSSSQVMHTLSTGKTAKVVSCEHSYECGCVGEGSNKICSTCYEHNNDIKWKVFGGHGFEETIATTGEHDSAPTLWEQVVPHETVFDYTKRYRDPFFKENVSGVVYPSGNAKVAVMDSATMGEYTHVRFFDATGTAHNSQLWNNHLRRAAAGVYDSTNRPVSFTMTVVTNADEIGAYIQQNKGVRKFDVNMFVMLDKSKSKVVSAQVYSQAGKVFDSIIKERLIGKAFSPTVIVPDIYKTTLARYTPVEESVIQQALAAQDNFGTAEIIILIVGMILAIGIAAVAAAL